MNKKIKMSDVLKEVLKEALKDDWRDDIRIIVQNIEGIELTKQMLDKTMQQINKCIDSLLQEDKRISVDKLIKFLKKEMGKAVALAGIKTKYASGFLQGKFDLLMDIDRKLKLGAFIEEK